MPPHILIVEDEIIIADTISRYLVEKGYNVIGTAISYAEAEQLYRREEPDIALLDIRLSGRRTGIDFACFMREQLKPRPFIYLTSQLDSRTLDSAKATFPAGYLSKPIQRDTLYATIEIALHNDQYQQRVKDSILLQTREISHRVAIDDILYLVADHVYVNVELVDGRQVVVRSSLQELLDRLPDGKFLQTHRSYVINVDRIDRWDAKYVYLRERKFPLSRSRREAIRKQLGERS